LSFTPARKGCLRLQTFKRKRILPQIHNKQTLKGQSEIPRQATGNGPQAACSPNIPRFDCQADINILSVAAPVPNRLYAPNAPNPMDLRRLAAPVVWKRDPRPVPAQGMT